VSGALRQTLGTAHIERQAERAEDMAAYCRDNRLPDEADQWQAEANAWRIELPPVEMEPGEIIEADVCEIEPEP
jgi:hypothetical protein